MEELQHLLAWNDLVLTLEVIPTNSLSIRVVFNIPAELHALFL